MPRREERRDLLADGVDGGRGQVGPVRAGVGDEALGAIRALVELLSEEKGYEAAWYRMLQAEQRPGPTSSLGGALHPVIASHVAPIHVLAWAVVEVNDELKPRAPCALCRSDEVTKGGGGRRDL